MRFWQRLWQAEDGVSAIEFAILVPVLILMMFGIIEFGLIMLASNMMESATSITSRLGKTGYSASGESREDTLLASVRDHTSALLDPDKLSISSKYYDQFDEIGDAEPWNDRNHNGIAEVGEYTDVNGNGTYDTDMGSSGYGNAEDIVVYSIHYPWPILTPIMREVIGDEDGNFEITAHAVVKNEPYDD